MKPIITIFSIIITLISLSCKKIALINPLDQNVYYNNKNNWSIKTPNYTSNYYSISTNLKGNILSGIDINGNKIYITFNETPKNNKPYYLTKEISTNNNSSCKIKLSGINHSGIPYEIYGENGYVFVTFKNNDKCSAIFNDISLNVSPYEYLIGGLLEN